MRTNSDFRILIVDDEQFNIDVVMGFLEDEGYMFNFTTNGKDALSALFKKDFDLVLLDINMPELDGIEVCKRIKKDDKTKDIPVIFLSAFSDMDTISKAFDAGGVDYLTKPFNGIELIARVKTHIQLRKYIYELKEKQEKLATLASTDIQTGLANRLRFSSALKKEISLVKSNPSRLTIAYLKIDNFQKLNNLLGYKNADKVLVSIAKLLQINAKEQHLVTRLFSSDFVIMMPNTSLEGASHILKTIYQKIEKTSIANLTITCSTGIAEYQKDETQDQFILRAEKIMESIKTRGGNMVLTKVLHAS